MSIEHPPQPSIDTAALIRSTDQHVLLVKHDAGWALPGGPARHGEDLAAACARHIRDTTGLGVRPSRVLVVLHVPATDTEGIHLVFDGGVAGAEQEIRLPAESFRWAGPSDLEGVPTATRQRIVHALRSMAGGAPYVAGPAAQRRPPGDSPSPIDTLTRT